LDERLGSASGKGELKGAAQHLERGMARYADNDLVGALVEFEKALELFGSSRGKQFAAWVREVQMGVNGPPTLDDDTLGAMAEALEEPKSGKRPRPPQVLHEPEPTRPERGRKLTPPPVMSSVEKPRPPSQMETAATMTLPQPPPATPKVTRDPGEHHGESPWDPVPLTPGGSEAPAQLRGSRRKDDAMAELQSQATKAAPPPARLPPGPMAPGSSSTILGMPALEPKLLTPQNRKRNKVAEDRPESVTREFRSATPTGPNLRPLDVPELTDEQIQGLLSLDSPLIPEGRTTPQIELDRIDGLDESPEIEAAERIIEMDAHPTPLPHQAPPGLKPLVKNDTNPMGVESFSGEFEPSQHTPTGIKPGGLKPVRESQPEDDPYADLNLLPLEVAPDLSGPDEVEEGGTNPTNPFIRGTHASKLAQYTSYGSAGEPKLEDMPPLPTLPGTKTPGHPLGMAEAALQAGDLGAAVDACEKALTESGGLGGTVARDHLPLVEQIYGAILGGAERTPVHGRAVGDLEPRSAFLLSRIDGSMTVEDVLDVSGMPRLEALRVMALLVRRGAVVIK
jgi:hypothetical protein